MQEKPLYLGELQMDSESSEHQQACMSVQEREDGPVRSVLRLELIESRCNCMSSIDAWNSMQRANAESKLIWRWYDLKGLVGIDIIYLSTYIWSSEGKPSQSHVQPIMGPADLPRQDL